MTPFVPRPQRGPAVREGFFRKDEFRYDAERDAYICPAGQVLATRYESKLRDLDNVRAEFSLTALVYNMRRAINILGVEELMRAVRA